MDMVSLTGSEAVRREVEKVVQGLFGKALLELRQRFVHAGLRVHRSAKVVTYMLSAAIVAVPDADLTRAVPTVFFGAVGTASQRCTATLDGGNFVMPTIAIPQEVNVKAKVWSTSMLAPVLKEARLTSSSRRSSGTTACRRA
ncbi:hypothetical protein BD310DRAFT_938825 [Dichomitus squalens]|nr:hypothetical protein BD310DRAFT_938825 [Dichomitus squalens]